MFQFYKIVTAKELTVGNVIHTHQNYYYVTNVTPDGDNHVTVEVIPAEPNVRNPLLSTLMYNEMKIDTY